MWIQFWQAVQHRTSSICHCSIVIVSQEPCSSAGHLVLLTDYSQLKQTLSLILCYVVSIQFDVHNVFFSNQLPIGVARILSGGALFCQKVDDLFLVVAV